MLGSPGIGGGEGDTTAVAAFWKEHEGVYLLCLYNLCDEPQTVMITLPKNANRALEKLFGDAEKLEINGDQLTAHLNRYQFLWLHFID